jgi:hypothetical protein
MLLRPAYLPWWGWVLCSVGATITCIISFVIVDQGKGNRWFALLIAMVSGFAGLVTGAMGFILFIKWFWNS